jgi:glycosyltransferase involved in cell wall biosynthesis
VIRVGLEVSPLEQTRAGTAQYLHGLIPALEARGDVEVRRLGQRGRGRLAAVRRDVAWYLHGLPRRAREQGVDVLHCPTFRGPLRSDVRLVVTVLDLAVLRYPEFFNRWNRTYSRLAVPRVVRAARRLIAISEFTKRELVELLGVDADSVTVVPVPPRDGFGPSGERADGEYVLAVGTLEPRKNLRRLAEAARLAGVELRVVGASGWGGVAVGGDGVRWLGSVDDDELARLYRGAVCFAYPSLYEGFGIPILEAFTSGTPVVTSAGGATEEVAGGAAVLVDPHDARAIADGISAAVRRRDELARLGFARAAEFSWDDVAERTVGVYRAAIG